MLLTCRWPQLASGLPRRLVSGALALSGLYDLEPLRQTPFLQADLRLTPALVRRLSPAFFPRPAGPLHALVGAEESEEFIRQNQLIRDQWGPTSVPVCESLPGRNHFSVLTDFVDSVSAELMVENLERLRRTHVVLFVALRDPELDAVAHAEPHSQADVSRSVAAYDLLRERERVLGRLRRLGVLCVDSTPAGLSSRLLNRYLDVRRRELV